LLHVCMSCKYKSCNEQGENDDEIFPVLIHSVKFRTCSQSNATPKATGERSVEQEAETFVNSRPVVFALMKENP
jgi:hypothetical protein